MIHLLSAGVVDSSSKLVGLLRRMSHCQDIYTALIGVAVILQSCGSWGFVCSGFLCLL